MASNFGPRCPACGYDIFGIRGMRCPECGRTLDVRDFNPGAPDTSADLRRYERNSAIGGLLGLAILTPILLVVLLLIDAFGRQGALVWELPVIAGFFLLWTGGLAVACRDSLVSWWRSGRRR